MSLVAGAEKYAKNADGTDATAVTIPVAGSVKVYVRDVFTARGVIVRFRGGSNTNALASMAIRNSYAVNTAALQSQTIVSAITVTNITTSGDDSTGTATTLIPSSATVPCIQSSMLELELAAATGDITGVVITFEPIYEADALNASHNLGRRVSPSA